MWKFKKPEGGYYTEAEMKKPAEPKRGESGGILVDNLHARRMVTNEEAKAERPRKDPDDKAEGLRGEVVTENAGMHKVPNRRRKL